MKGPASPLKDAPVEVHRPSHKYLATSVDSPSSVGLRFEASPFDPRFHLLYSVNLEGL